MATCRRINPAELPSLADEWNALAGGVPFRRHEWLATWWQHYGAGRELHVLVIEESVPDHPQPRVIGLAPLYLERSLTRGRVLRLLGDGEVCSDYVGILGNPEHSQRVAASIADWLAHTAAQREHEWDIVRLEGVDPQDATTVRLVEELEARGGLVHRREGPNCWRLELPATWATYEAMLSKSHRKQIRRLIDRVLDGGHATLHTVSTPSDLEIGERTLIDLHQRRRQMLNEPGCFASASFKQFHQDAMRRLLAAGQLRLHWLELDGQPAAAEYHVAGCGVIYGYQSGVAPELLEQEPGRLAAIATLRLAIEQGFTAMDFLRGDEPYKAHFRAQPRRLVEFRIAAPRTAAQLRHRAWSASEHLKGWWRTHRDERTQKHASQTVPPSLTTNN